MAPAIIQVPGIYFGYPTRGNHGRSGVSPVAIVHHTIEGSIEAYIRLVRGQLPGYENAAHFSVGLDGAIRQHVQLGDAAWTNGLNWTKGGPSYWRSDPALWWLAEAYRRRISPNNYTISIEEEGHSGVPLTGAQIASTVELDTWLMRQYPAVKLDRVHLVGHCQIDGINKQRCPGPAFPWGPLLESVRELLTPVSTIPQDVLDYAKAHSLGDVRVGKGLSYVDEVEDGVYKTTSGAVILKRHYDPPGDLTVQIDHVDWKPPSPPEVVEKIIYPDAAAVLAIASRLRANAEELESLPGVK